MLTVESGEYATIEIKKSKFISIAINVKTKDDVQKNLDKIKSQFQDASHICYAYKIENFEKYFDDNEPSGTAGKRIFSVIDAKKLENVLIVVVRYFGGIKLGAGVLSRTYSKSASLSIDFAKTKIIEKKLEISFSVRQENLYKVYSQILVSGVKLVSSEELKFVVECDKILEKEILEKLDCIKAENILIKEILV